MTARTLEIPLSIEQRTALGDLIAIHGMIASMLEMSWLTLFPRGPMERPSRPGPVRHDGLGKDAERWLELYRPHLQPVELAIAEKFHANLKENLVDRSDLVHAVFVIDTMRDGKSVGWRSGGNLNEGPIVAKRLGRDKPHRPASDLIAIRDKAEAIYWLLHDLLVTIGMRRYAEQQAFNSNR